MTRPGIEPKSHRPLVEHSTHQPTGAVFDLSLDTELIVFMLCENIHFFFF